MLFVGESEYTWPQFVRDYESGTWQPEYRQDEKPSMLDSPLPRFDLLKVGRYRSMAIQFARGPVQLRVAKYIGNVRAAARGPRQ